MYRLSVPLFLVVLSLTSCRQPRSSPPPPPPRVASVKQAVKAPPPPPKRVSKRKGNTKGHVFIVEYHHIATDHNDMFRPVKEFQKDLEWYYKRGFRPVTMTEYVSDKMPLPPGASPLILTFDDSNSDQFRVLKDGTIDPNCAVGVWQAFAAKHPDFPVKGTFYILPDPWHQHPLINQKIQFLLAQGSEIGNHTTTHPDLGRLSDERVEQEIGAAQEAIVKLGAPVPTAMAYPYGVRPRNHHLMEGFNYDGQRVQFTSAVLAGAEPALAPDDPKLKPLAIPRILAVHKRMGLNYWMKRFDNGAVKVYVQP